jgi:hypothetical protein
LSLQRNVRDNYNQLFLSEAIKDQMMLWHSMNQQFFFDGSDDSKVIRIVGRDAVTFFEEAGLSEQGIDDETMETLTSPEMEEVISDPGFDMNEVMKPLFPVSTPEGNIPKMVIEDGGEVGHLVMEPGDISGYYDYIPDVRSMSNPEPAMSQALAQLINQAKDPAAIQARAADGVRLKISELEKDFFELSGLKNADKYFEPVSPEEANAESQINGIGEGAFGAGASAGGPNGVQGVPGGAEALAGGAQG